MNCSVALVAVCSTLLLCSISAQAPSSFSFSAQNTSSITEVKGGKTYIAGIRSTKDGHNFCLGVLISPSHVLTSTVCIPHNIRWVSLGSNSSSGTSSGEQIKVVALLVHPNNTDYRHDFLILELDLATELKPVLLDSHKTIVQIGMKGARLGWNDTLAEAVQSRYLQSVEVDFVSNKVCSKHLSIDKSNLCSHSESSCKGDKGGAVIVTLKKIEILVGIVSSNEGCGQVGGISIYSRVSAVRPWIDAIIQNICVA